MPPKKPRPTHCQYCQIKLNDDNVSCKMENGRQNWRACCRACFRAHERLVDQERAQRKRIEVTPVVVYPQYRRWLAEQLAEVEKAAVDYPPLPIEAICEF